MAKCHGVWVLAFTVKYHTHNWGPLLYMKMSMGVYLFVWGCFFVFCFLFLFLFLFLCFCFKKVTWDKWHQLILCKMFEINHFSFLLCKIKHIVMSYVTWKMTTLPFTRIQTWPHKHFSTKITQSQLKVRSQYIFIGKNKNKLKE